MRQGHLMRVGWEGLGTENIGGKVGEGETVAMDVVGGKEDFWEMEELVGSL